jgi:hypothetical protein
MVMKIQAAVFRVVTLYSDFSEGHAAWSVGILPHRPRLENDSIKQLSTFHHIFLG